MVTAPDGTAIPVPSGGIGLSNGREVEIRTDAQVEIQTSGDGYYVVVNNSDPANEEAVDLFDELATEGAIKTIETLAEKAFAEVPEMVIEGAGFFTGVLVSVFTSSKLTEEVFIRATLSDSEIQVTYCLLL